MDLVASDVDICWTELLEDVSCEKIQENCYLGYGLLVLLTVFRWLSMLQNPFAFYFGTWMDFEPLFVFMTLAMCFFCCQDCAALLAYEQPHKSSVGYLLRDSQRELVADAVNAMILSTNRNMKNSRLSMISSLEMLIRQLTACFLETRSLNGDQGEAFHLHRILESGKK